MRPTATIAALLLPLLGSPADADDGCQPHGAYRYTATSAGWAGASRSTASVRSGRELWRQGERPGRALVDGSLAVAGPGRYELRGNGASWGVELAPRAGGPAALSVVGAEDRVAILTLWVSRPGELGTAPAAPFELSGPTERRLLRAWAALGDREPRALGCREELVDLPAGRHELRRSGARRPLVLEARRARVRPRAVIAWARSGGAPPETGVTGPPARMGLTQPWLLFPAGRYRLGALELRLEAGELGSARSLARTNVTAFEARFEARSAGAGGLLEQVVIGLEVGGRAARAGLKIGDRVVAIEGRPPDREGRAFQGQRGSSTLRVKVRRAGRSAAFGLSLPRARLY